MPRHPNPNRPPKPAKGGRPKNPETAKMGWKGKRQEGKAEKDKRIRLLLDIISTGQYVTHVTPSTLAKQWGIGQHNVEEMAAEAARFIRMRMADDDILGATLLGGLQTIFASAVSGGEAGDAVKSALAIVGIKEKLWKVGQAGYDCTNGVDMAAETMALELSLVDEARAAAAANEAAPAPPQPPPVDEGPKP